MAKGKSKGAAGATNTARPNGKAWKKSTAAAIAAGTFTPSQRGG